MLKLKIQIITDYCAKKYVYEREREKKKLTFKADIPDFMSFCPWVLTAFISPS